ncbi:MAG: hypothetical protein R3C49_05860 [Planctomycetaceae bacterium]
MEHSAHRFPWAASGRAQTLGRTEGITKMIVDPKTQRILGIGMVGPGAGEMIAEAVIALEMAPPPETSPTPSTLTRRCQKP